VLICLDLIRARRRRRSVEKMSWHVVVVVVIVVVRKLSGCGVYCVIYFRLCNTNIFFIVSYVCVCVCVCVWVNVHQTHHNILLHTHTRIYLSYKILCYFYEIRVLIDIHIYDAMFNHTTFPIRIH